MQQPQCAPSVRQVWSWKRFAFRAPLASRLIIANAGGKWLAAERTAAKRLRLSKSRKLPSMLRWRPGETRKKCPACGEEIKSIAMRCRFCKTDFDTVDPLTVGDLRRQAVRDEKTESLQKSLVATFVVSLFGCLAPLMLIISCVLVLPNRDRLAKASPLYWVMGYASLGLSAIYTLLIILFFISELSA